MNTGTNIQLFHNIDTFSSKIRRLFLRLSQNIAIFVAVKQKQCPSEKIKKME